ncbi:helix-turn-helix transcriptional regulator [Chryseobacterium sp. RP-3-3]|uniref:Helix-turn-helix transcriptional regulator n=1 Tax=Chryseobacterium antibioticum TaxID=2728847 RepID=A0A7Y0AJ77_9FLAO|nr:AraC family transcriptional regulator [Chryseobacterium antibioticum]NML68334.1 helix-turn-helix transcriptional regulator [Chryseobacterium antibioticum]
MIKKNVNLYCIYKMMKFISLFLFLTNLLCAQSQVSGNLKKLKYEELKNNFYNYYDNNKIEQSKSIAHFYLQKAKNEKNNLQIADGYILIHFNENYSNAFKYLDSVALVTKNLKGTIYPSQTYLMKGNLYYKYDNLKAALDNYILGLQYAKKQKNQKLTAYANMNIAYINSYIGKNLEAAKIFRYYLYRGNNITDDYQHNQIRIALISCYLEINKLDSADFLIKEGQESALIGKNKYNPNLYSYLSGTYNLKLKEYKTAIRKLSDAYIYFTNSKENTSANYALYNLGKAYEGEKNKEKVVETYIQLDSNVQKYDITFPELREAYTYLIDYYKEKNNTKKQLYYIDRFLKVDKKLDEQFQYLSTELPKKYDTPNLLQEKESIINELKNRKTILNVSVGFLLIILLLLSFLYYRSKKTEKQHRKIAQDLINSIEMKNLETPPVAQLITSPSPAIVQIETEEDKATEDKTSKITSEDITQLILKELEVFEAKELFLKKGITSSSLAKSIKTNTTYLSEVINTQKGKNFAAYLNDLRIDYALNRLIKDKKFRSYKLSVISEELGYNNDQAFSLAFKKKTGTTLSIYIKEIEKTHQSSINP